MANSKFSDCMEIDGDDEERTLHSRLVNIWVNGALLLLEPTEMGWRKIKKYFRSKLLQQLFKQITNSNELLFAWENPEPLVWHRKENDY